MPREPAPEVRASDVARTETGDAPTLPAFITAPVRAAPTPADLPGPENAASTGLPAPEAAADDAAPRFPRRRRRPRVAATADAAETAEPSSEVSDRQD